MLKENDKAPEFTLPDENGTPVSLSDFAGQKVILYFYPRDLTPGCTRQAQGFSDIIDAINEKNTVVLGVSKDSTESHLKFIDKGNLRITLLSDPEKQVITQYGAWGEKNNYGQKTLGVIRTTFLIDENGTISKVWKNVRVAGHCQKVYESL